MDQSPTSTTKHRLSSSEPTVAIEPLPVDHQIMNRIRQSDCTIAELREEVNTLRSLVERLSLENCDLRSKITPTFTNSATFYANRNNGSFNNSNDSGVEMRNETQRSSPISSVGNGHSIDVEPVQDIKSKTSQRPASMYETRDRDWQSKSRDDPSRNATQSLYQCPKASSVSGVNSNGGQQLVEEINKRTNQVTRRIQELWACIQNSEYKTDAVPCAERIRVAVAELTAVITQHREDDVIKGAMRQLITGTARLQVECGGLQRASRLGQATQTETYLHLVRTCAYDIAKATKLILEFSSRM